METSKMDFSHIKRVKVNHFIAAVLVTTLASYGCQPTNKVESITDTATLDQRAPVKTKVRDSATLENGIQVAMFIEQAALGAMQEIDMGKLASDRALRSDIRNFGALMMQEYTKVNLELSALAAIKGLRLPGVLRQKQARQIQEMSAINKDYFERLYLKIVIEEHDKYIELFQGALSSPDGEVNSFAGKFLPALQKYRQNAYELRSNLK